MKSGKLTKRISIETFTESQSGTGEVSKAWVLLATRWADPVPLSGREYFTGKQIESDISIVFKIRYDTIVSATSTKMRVNYKGSYYDIESVINLEERNKELHLMCKSI